MLRRVLFSFVAALLIPFEGRAAPRCEGLFGALFASPAASLQITAWRALERGEGDLARELESRLENLLLHDEILKVEKWSGGVSESYRIHFKSGLKALYKPSPEFWKSRVRAWLSGGSTNPSAEVDAYRIDRELELGVVPVTVEREINGGKGSLQLWVEAEVLRGEGRRREEMKVLDYLIQNSDRQPRNILTSDGQVVAIDHGISFPVSWNHSGNVRPPLLKALRRSAVHERVYRRLKNTFTPERVRTLLGDRYPKPVIDAVVERRNALLQKFEEER